MLKKLSLRMRLTIYLIVISIILLGTVAVLENSKQSTVFSHLAEIRDTNKVLIEEFFTNQVEYITDFSTEDKVLGMMEVLTQLYQSNEITDSTKYTSQIRSFESTFKNYAGRRRLQSIILVHNDGTVLYSTRDEGIFGTNMLSGEYRNTGLGQVIEKAEIGEIALSDLAIFKPTDKLSMFLAKPLEQDGKTVGFLVFEWLDGNLSRTFTRPVKFGDSEDTYLIGSDMLMRTNSRLVKEDTVLVQTVDTQAAEQILAQKTGIVKQSSYQGTTTLTAYAPISFMGIEWGIITEVKAIDALNLTFQLKLLIYTLIAMTIMIIIFLPYIPAKYKVKQYWTETFWAYLYMLPVFAVLGLFVFYPVIKSFTMSFYDWDLIGARTYIGLDNFKELFGDRLFIKAIINTSYFVFVSVPITISLSLFIAILLNSNIKARSWYRMAFFIPWITSPVAATMVWKWIFNYNNYGLLNYFLLKLTHLVNWFAHIFTLGAVDQWLHFAPINWLNNPDLTIPNLILLSVWKMMGYNIVIFLAGLQNVPKELYEAAEVDGASKWQKFRHITLPLISPTTFFISIISIIGAFKIFTQVFVLYNGGTGLVNSGLTMVFYVYKKAFGDFRMGYASAGAYVLFFIIFAFTLVQMRLSKNRVHYS